MPTYSNGDVYEALKTIWDADSSLSGFGGPYHSERPPSPSPSFPYVVFMPMPSQRAARSNTSLYRDVRFQFLVRDRTPELVYGHLATIGAAFGDDTAISLDTGTVLRLSREGEGDSQEDDNVHVGYLEFLVVRQVAR